MEPKPLGPVIGYLVVCPTASPAVLGQPSTYAAAAATLRQALTRTPHIDYRIVACVSMVPEAPNG